MKASLWLTLSLLAIYSCQCAGQEEKESRDPRSQHEIQESRMNARKDFIEREAASIESYIKDRNFDMQRSGTGIYYNIDRDTTQADSIFPGDVVRYNYEVYMLNGSLLYSSSEDGPATLRIDRQDAIIGLHESLQKLTLGDKGRFIIPSHLAYGISGDQSKVPPLTALQYNLEVLNIDKSNRKK